jgi:hypothetical protein
VSGGAALRPRWLPQPNLALHRTLWEIHIKIFSSETTGPIATKTLVEWSLVGPLPKLCPVIATFNQDGCQAKNRKKGNEVLKTFSPLKLLSQSQPHFAEMIFGWFPSKIVSGISVLRPRWPPKPNSI